MDSEQDNTTAEHISAATKPLFYWHKLYLPASILIAAVLISGSILYTKSGVKAPSLQGNIAGQAKADVSVDDDPYLGDVSAPVKIIEFSDFQCPFCRTFWRDVLPSIKKDYIDTGKVQFVYRDFPLSFHAAALASALAADCAKDQSKYWEMHDKMFLEEDKLGTGTVTYGVNDLKKWAKELGLNMKDFNQCLDSQKHKSEVDKDVEDGTKAGVSGTPTSYINGMPIVGAQPYSVFKVAVDKAIEETSRKKGFFK